MTESSGHAAGATIGAEPFWPFPGEILVNGGDGEIVLQGTPGEVLCVVPFTIGGVHNLYEWSMVLGDLHPVRTLGAVGSAEEGFGDLRRNTIEIFSRSRAIFKALLAARKRGDIKPVLAWDEEEPDDKTLLRFRREDVLKVISELGADGIVIRMLMAVREQQTDEVKVQSIAPSENFGATNKAVGAGEPEPGATTRRRGRNPGDGTKDDAAAVDRMVHIIAANEATSPTAAGKLVAQENGEPAAFAYRRLADKFIRAYGPLRREREPWGDTCRRVADEMQMKCR